MDNNDLDLSMYGIKTGSTGEKATLEERLTYIIRKMLQTAYTFADKIPSKAYMYLQLHPDNRAVLECLFEIEGSLYEIQELNDADIEHDFNISEEKQLEWLGFMSQGVNELRELFDNSDRWFPDEVWGWVDIENNAEVRSKIQWGPKNYTFPDAKAVIRGWKYELENLPENFDEWLTDVKAIESSRWDMIK